MTHPVIERLKKLRNDMEFLNPHSPSPSVGLLDEAITEIVAMLTAPVTVWHPASEPPDTDRLVVVSWSDGGVVRGRRTDWDSWRAIIGGAKIVYWTELPPLPEETDAEK